MFEVIDPSVTVTGRPISQWIGDVTRQNVIELAERGAGGGYVWSVQSVSGVATLQISDQSPLSTHPDYFYSIPFVINGTPYQTTLTVEFLCEVGNGTVDVALWCEGRASAVTSNIITGTHTLSLTLPARLPSNDMRCALLVRSNVGALVDTGDIIFATDREIRIFTSQAPAVQSATHLLLEITGTGEPVRGWQGESRYHAMRGTRRPGSIEPDLFEVWPSPDASLNTPEGYTLLANLYALGTITLYSLQVRFETAQAIGLPQPDETYPTQPVRATWLQRMARYLRDVYLSSPQYAWIGGAGGINRSTYNADSVPGTTVIQNRYWGAWINNPIGGQSWLETAIRARTGVDGIIISILYSSVAPAGVLVQFDGVAATQVTLPAAPAAARSRDFPSQPGTVSWRHGPLTRDQCGSQDIGLHGTELEGFQCDTGRFSLATIQQEWEVITPTIGDLVRIVVNIGSSDQLYIACISVRELQNARSLANMNNPAIVPLQPIETVSWDSLRQRMQYLYESRVRCVYSECSVTGSFLSQLTNGRFGTLAIIAYTTSPDLPYGLPVLRFTVDAECIGGGNLVVSLSDGVTTVSLFFVARVTLTADLAVTSNTSYTLSIGGSSSAPLGTSRIYLMRIEEIYP